MYGSGKIKAMKIDRWIRMKQFPGNACRDLVVSPFRGKMAEGILKTPVVLNWLAEAKSRKWSN